VEIRQFLCLARYEAGSGFRVAAMHFDGERLESWARLMSHGKDGALSMNEVRYRNKSPARPLDVFEAPVEAAAGNPPQTENLLVGQRPRWRKIGAYPRELLGDLCSSPLMLWSDKTSTKAGSFDRVLAPEAAELESSLLLIELDRYIVDVTRRPVSEEKVVRVRFRHLEREYRLLLCEDVLRRRYARHSPGEYEVARPTAACITLGPPGKQGRIKRVASLIPLEERTAG